MHLTPLLFLLVSTLVSSSQSSSTRRPLPRSYDTHQYYTLELSSTSTSSLASSVAQSLGVELVEPLGELAGHWLVRVPGFTPYHTSTNITRRSIATTSDPVLERWTRLRSRTPRSLQRHQLRSLAPLSLRQRSKRVVPPSNHALTARDDSELVQAQTQLGIADPIFDQQWHLVNREMKDVELNVTGLWSRGITGDGVSVVVVDDGLDANSDDLSPNFVSEPHFPSLHHMCH